MNDDSKYETIPEERNEVNNLFTRYSLSGEPDDFSALVDYNYNVAIITALMKSVSTDQIYFFVKNMEEYIKNNISEDLNITIAGMLVAFRDLVNLIVESSLISIISAIFMIFNSLFFSNLYIGHYYQFYH